MEIRQVDLYPDEMRELVRLARQGEVAEVIDTVAVILGAPEGIEVGVALEDLAAHLFERG